MRKGVLTQNVGQVTVPLSIPEQVDVPRWEHSLACLTQRKPAKTNISNCFACAFATAAQCITWTHLTWAPDFYATFLEHHLWMKEG